jgi:hypothetical protein
MCPFTIFLYCNYGVLPAWALLMMAPDSIWTRRLVHSALVPLLLATVYVAALVINPDNPEGASFGSLEGVMALFSGPWIVLGGWVHYLVFDLFIGAWEARDAARRGIRHLFVVPCLFFTLMLGPVGLGMYLLLRAATTREWLLEETTEAAS